MHSNLDYITMPPFGLFRKREKTEGAQIEQPAISAPTAGPLSIQEAQELLQKIESTNVEALATRLSPVKESAAQSLKAIRNIADEMEHEKIKLEDLERRYKSVIENSRRTVVSSLKRESSAELELPHSVNDARKFKEKFESMLNRFGEVTGSHSKLLNNFMKKHSNRLKAEFEKLRKLLDEAKAIMADFDQKRAPVVKCGNILNTASQKASSIRSAETYLQDAQKELSEIESDLKKIDAELQAVKNSQEFDRASAVAQRITQARDQQEQLKSQMLELFSHASRAFTKYSYGLSRETEARLNTMSTEPWMVLRESDISPYSSLLIDVRKSVQAGKIQLKDSDKMLHYIDVILRSLPELQKKSQSLEAQLESLGREDSSSFAKSRELEQKTAERNQELVTGRYAREQQARQNEERKKEVGILLKEAEDILFSLSDHRYSLHY